MKTNIKVKNKRISDEEFLRERKEVLSEWPTGKDADLDAAIEYHKSMPPGKDWVKRMSQAKKDGITLCAMEGMGHATIEQQIALISAAEKDGGADLLATTFDNFTRLHDFERAEQGIKESQKLGKTVLNGFPVVNHGVFGTRKVVEAVKVPQQMRYASMDPRLLVEIGLAAGHKATAGDASFIFLQHNNGKIPFDTVIHNYQYTHKLIAYYWKNGCPVSEQSYGGYPLVHPSSVVVAAQLAQMLLMAEQGSRFIGVAFPAQGHIIQDVASARIVPRLADEYLNKFGYNDVETYLELLQWYSRFPSDISKAYGVLAIHAITGKLSGAQMCTVRTVSEGRYIPGGIDLADSYKSGKAVINMLKDQKIELDSKMLAIEGNMFEKEVRAILDSILDFGDGDAAIGIIRAVEAGVVDVPYGTHPSIACKVMGVRDIEGAVRWLDTGNLPFTKDVIEFHKEKVAGRVKREGRAIDDDVIIDDLRATGEGTLLFPMI